MTLPEINNYFEIVLWTTVGIVLVFKSRKSVAKIKWLGVVSAGAFFVSPSATSLRSKPGRGGIRGGFSC